MQGDKRLEKLTLLSKTDAFLGWKRFLEGTVATAVGTSATKNFVVGSSGKFGKSPYYLFPPTELSKDVCGRPPIFVLLSTFSVKSIEFRLVYTSQPVTFRSTENGPTPRKFGTARGKRMQSIPGIYRNIAESLKRKNKNMG